MPEKKTRRHNQNQEREPAVEVLIGDDQYAKAEKMFADFRPGMRLAITRTRPSWCGGFLERIDCMEGEEIDVEYIIAKWGGKRFQLRVTKGGQYWGGCDLNLSAYPPKVHGRPVSMDDDFLPTGGPVKVPHQRSTPQNSFNPIDLVKLFMSQQEAQMKAMQRLFSEQNRPQLPPAEQNPPQQLVQQPTITEQMKNMVVFGKQIKQMQELLGGFGGDSVSASQAAEPDPANEMFSQILKLVTAMKSPPQSPPQPKVAPKRGVVGGTTSQSGTQSNTQNPNIAQVLSSLPPEQIQGILMESLRNMSEDKRADVIGGFISGTNLEEIFSQMQGEPFEDDEEYYEDEETDTDPRSYPNPQDSDQGGAIRPDESHDPNHREGDPSR